MRKISKTDENEIIFEYRCGTCYIIFRNLSELEMHEREHTEHEIHTDENPYSCTKCDKKFSVQSEQKQHENSCSGLKTY